MRVTKYKLENPNILVRESSSNYETEGNRLNQPKLVRDVLNGFFRLNMQAEEYLYMIAVDAKCKPIGFFEVSHGSVDMSMANPREIFIRALLCGAVQVFIAHNHPSGDPTPGKEDFKATEKIKSVGEMVGIPLADHIVVGEGNTYFSFREAGVL